MPDQLGSPQITPELAQAVTRLGHLRRQLKDLETEESLLRERIIAEISTWPRGEFPLKMGQFEVRLAERKGRIEPVTALSVLQNERLMHQVPLKPSIKDADQIDSLGRDLTQLMMPDETRGRLIESYKASIDWQPLISPEVVTSLYNQARLTPNQYKACFKEQKPVVLVLTVR